jgi:hypothetical protein
MTNLYLKWTSSDLPGNLSDYTCNPASFAPEDFICLLKIAAHCYILIICHYICIIIFCVNSLTVIHIGNMTHLSLLTAVNVGLVGELVGRYKCFG